MSDAVKAGLLLGFVIMLSIAVMEGLQVDDLEAKLQACQSTGHCPLPSSCTIERQSEGVYVLRVVECAETTDDRYLHGRVLDTNNRPLSKAQIQVAQANLVAETDLDGHFDLTFNSDSTESEYSAIVIASGYWPWRGIVVPDSNPLVVQLQELDQ